MAFLKPVLISEQGLRYYMTLIFVILQKLLQHGQERDHFLAEMRQKEEQDHVLELRQTIQIMQEKLDEREGKAFTPF